MRHGSESESEDGCGPTRRSRSVAPPGRRLLSAAATPLSISTSDLSGGGGRTARASPALCSDHRAPRVCRRPSCAALHVCRLYVDGFCPNSDAACRWGHAVSSEGNRAALAAHQLQALPERELLWLVRALLRQTAPVTAEEYRSQLAVCPQYAAGARCSRPDCFQLHLCPRLAAGRCGAGAACRWSHRLTDPDNVMVLLRLRCAELSEAEVLDRLARNGDRGDSDSGRSGPVDTESEGEPESYTAGAGAVGGVSSPQQRYRMSSGTSDGAGQSAGYASSDQKTTYQRYQACSRPGGQADHPVSPGKPSALSKDELLRIARTLEICHDYGYPSKCPNKSCNKLHLCRYYLAGICPYAIIWCSRSHNLADAHNKALLSRHQLLTLSQAQLLGALRDGYLSRTPITNLERRFLVQMCRPYQRGQCKMGVSCTRVHICGGYVSGECQNSSVCGLSHNLVSCHNAAVVRDLGLFSLFAKDIREILQNPVTAKEMWESVTPKQQNSASSNDSDPGVQRSSNGQATQSEGEKSADGSASRNPPIPAPRSLASLRRVESPTPASAMTANSSGDLSGDGSEEARTATGIAGTLPEGAGVTGGGNGDSKGISQLANPGEESANKPASKRPDKSAKLPKDKSKKPKPPPKTLTKEDMMQIARNLDVCRHYFFPSKCVKQDCNKIHLCRFFIACKCTYAIYKCVRSHYLWDDPHNTRVLQNHGLEKLSEQDIFRALRDGYLAQNPVTDTERRYLVQMCRPHQRGFCNKPKLCTRIHICDGYILHKCESSATCGLSHNLNSEHNAAVVRNLGLQLTAGEIKAILANPVTAKDMWESSVPKLQNTPPSGSTRTSSANSGTPWQNSASNMSQEGNDAGPMTAAEETSDSQTDGESEDSESEESEEDSEDLPEEGPILCPEHVRGARCRGADCEGFHICGFYLANICRRPDGSCPLGHSFGEPHNVRMMNVYGLLGGSPEHFQELLDQMTLRARITFSNQAEEKVSMCIPFNSPGGCTSEDCCGRFHLCNRFLAGTCTKQNCDRHHSLSDRHNQQVRKMLGLAAAPGGQHRHAWATDRDVVELIRAKLGVRPGVYKAAEVVEVAGEEAELADVEEESADEEEESADGEEESGDEEGSADEEAEEDDGEAESADREAESADGEAESADKEAESADPEAESADAEEEAEASAEETKPMVKVTELVDGRTNGEVSDGSKPGPELPEPTPEVAPSPRSAEDADIEPLPRVCASLTSGRRCRDLHCRAVHICPHFLAGACRRQRCTLGHSLETESNRRVLREAGRDITKQNHEALIKELYCASANVRRSQTYSRLRICISNNHVQGCRILGCPYLHLCQRFVVGTCGGDSCIKGHSLHTEGNRQKLRQMRLDTAPDGEILEMLRAVHGTRSLCK